MFSTTLNQFAIKHKQVLLALICLSIIALNISCGKRKPPLPPIEKVPQRLEISGYQRGDQIIISWTMPSKNASDTSLLNINRADVYRLTESFSSKTNVTEEEFASRSTVIESIDIAEQDFDRKKLTFADKLSFAGQAVRLKYAVRLVNSQGQKAGFSNFLVIEPASRVALAPGSPTAEISQESVTIRWAVPVENIDGSAPANVLGYNVYRADQNAPPRVLNSAPVTATEFRDRSFEFGRQYAYFIRTVSLGSNGDPVESSDSVIIGATPVDTFAPAAPSALTIAATPTTISLFFASNPDPDIAGYRVYRSVDRGQPEEDWELITPELLATNTFQDSRVESGRRYFYFVKALDKTGNVSSRSEIVSEMVP